MTSSGRKRLSRPAVKKWMPKDWTLSLNSEELCSISVLRLLEEPYSLSILFPIVKGCTLWHNSGVYLGYLSDSEVEERPVLLSLFSLLDSKV